MSIVPRFTDADLSRFAELARLADADAYACLSKFCGGKGSGVPGTCPKGEAKAHLVARAHANAAAYKLHQAALAHTKSGTEASAQKLQAAIDEHNQLHAKATAAASAAKVKALDAQKAGGPSGATAKATGPGSRGGKGKPQPVGRKPAAKAKPVAAPEPAPPEKPTHEQLASSVEKHAAALKAENAGAGGIVKVPELTDRVTADHPGAKPADVHDALQKMQKDDRLTLQLANDPRLEPRAAEGILSPRGNLHYVAMRPEPTGNPPGRPPGAETKPAGVPAEHVQAVVDATTTHGGEHNLASLENVRSHLAQQGITDRGRQDAAINQARREGRVTGSGAEGRTGLTPGQQAALLPEKDSHPIGHLSLRQHAEPFSEGSSQIKGAEIFAAGVHRGKEYTPADLDQMVSNFRQHSTGERPLLRVPAVLGHEENQEYLERSDLPAAAWCSDVYRDGNVLKADFEDVPPQVAALLKGRRYRTVSAEVYDQPPEGVPGEGKMLRRVAFLGGDIPQLKSLADIPLPQPHHERFATWTPLLLKFRECSPTPGVAGCYSCFAEVEPMDRNEMIAQLQQLGADTSTVTDAVPEAMLAEWLRTAQAQQQQSATGMDDEPAPGGPPPEGMYGELSRFMDGDSDELPEPDGDQQQQQYADRTRHYADRIKKMYEKYCGMGGQPAPEPHADEPPPVPAPMPAPGAPSVHSHLPPGPPKKVTMQYSEQQLQKLVADTVATALKTAVKPELDRVSRFAEDTIAAQKKARTTAELDTLQKTGQVLPSQRPALDEILLGLDATTAQKFSETDPKTGKATLVSATPFDRMLASLKAGPKLVAFGERVKTSGGKAGDADAEADKVQRFAEADANFQHALKANGKTPEAFVEKFRELKKQRPALTAKEYGVPDHYCQ